MEALVNIVNINCLRRYNLVCRMLCPLQKNLTGLCPGDYDLANFLSFFFQFYDNENNGKDNAATKELEPRNNLSVVFNKKFQDFVVKKTQRNCPTLLFVVYKRAFL